MSRSVCRPQPCIQSTFFLERVGGQKGKLFSSCLTLWSSLNESLGSDSWGSGAMKWRRCVQFKWKTSGLRQTSSYTAVVASLLRFSNFTNTLTCHQAWRHCAVLWVSFLDFHFRLSIPPLPCLIIWWSVISPWTNYLSFLRHFFQPLVSGLLRLLVVGQGRTTYISSIAFGST